jgi:hypothetical protein
MNILVARYKLCECLPIVVGRYLRNMSHPQLVVDCNLHATTMENEMSKGEKYTKHTNIGSYLHNVTGILMQSIMQGAFNRRTYRPRHAQSLVHTGYFLKILLQSVCLHRRPKRTWLLVSY